MLLKTVFNRSFLSPCPVCRQEGSWLDSQQELEEFYDGLGRSILMWLAMESDNAYEYVMGVHEAKPEVFCSVCDPDNSPEETFERLYQAIQEGRCD